jgi:uncharacterized protein YqfA (UPF0365 family)
MPQSQVIPFVVIAAMLLFVLAVFIVASFTLRLWLQAVLSGVPISVFQIIGMRLRKTNANVVVRNLIAAKQAGVSLSCVELERAYLQGCDVEKLTLAMIEANRRGMNVTFQEAVDAELHGRLQEKMKG